MRLASVPQFILGGKVHYLRCSTYTQPYTGGFENGYASLNDMTQIVLRSMELKQPVVAVTFAYRINGMVH